jgi:PBP1b-binding outer membrane lipoprotein LpoB
MSKLMPILLLAAFLAGCSNYESKAKEDAQKAADQKALQGEFVKSPDLDYSKYDGSPSLESKPVQKDVKSISPKKEPSGFKKSPVLDYSKY